MGEARSRRRIGPFEGCLDKAVRRARNAKVEN